MGVDFIQMQEVRQVFTESRVIPVATIHDASHTEALYQALQAGGIQCLEIVLRSEAAMEAIQVASRFNDQIIGAGTIRNIAQVNEAVQAGARFVVTPGFNSNVIKHCLVHEIPVFPGISTPTDLEMATALGIQTVKFFPADAFGGVKTIKALSAPYPEFRFIPTGGISTANLESYLALPQVIACGGSWMVKSDLIETGQFEEIQRITRETVNLVKNLK